MKETIFLNGKFVNSEEAKISVLNSGFLFGYGLFETMRSYQKRIVYFAWHMKRIMESSRLIGINPPYSIGRLKAVIIETVKLNGSRDTYVRLTLWKTNDYTGILVVAREYAPYPPKKYLAGFRACVSEFRQDENSFFTGIKATCRVMLELAYARAKENRFDEAIILNSRGYIAEVSRGNIFFVKDNELFTPSLECGCLKGITRKVIFDLAMKYNIGLNEGKFTLNDLYHADEAFLTNSLMGVMPLVSMEKISISRAAKLTKFFINKYNLLKS